MTPTARKAATAAMLSALVPGLGQFYNRHWWKGAAFLAAMIVADGAFNVTADTLILMKSAVGMTVEAGTMPPSIASLLVRSIPVMIVVLWSVADARKSALTGQAST